MGEQDRVTTDLSLLPSPPPPSLPTKKKKKKKQERVGAGVGMGGGGGVTTGCLNLLVARRVNKVVLES